MHHWVEKKLSKKTESITGIIGSLDSKERECCCTKQLYRFDQKQKLILKFNLLIEKHFVHNKKNSVDQDEMK